MRNLSIEHFRIHGGMVGLKYDFPSLPGMRMLIPPHTTPETVKPKDFTSLMSDLDLVKDAGPIAVTRFPRPMRK